MHVIKEAGGALRGLHFLHDVDKLIFLFDELNHLARKFVNYDHHLSVDLVNNLNVDEALRILDAKRSTFFI